MKIRFSRRLTHFKVSSIKSRKRCYLNTSCNVYAVSQILMSCGRRSSDKVSVAVGRQRAGLCCCGFGWRVAVVFA